MPPWFRLPLKVRSPSHPYDCSVFSLGTDDLMGRKGIRKPLIQPMALKEPNLVFICYTLMMSTSSLTAAADRFRAASSSGVKLI